MAKTKCLIKERLALLMICLLHSTVVNTKKMPQTRFPIQVTLQDPSQKLQVTSIITKKALKVKLLPAQGENQTKIITVPLPLNKNWKKTVTFSEGAAKNTIKKGKNGRIVGGNEVNPPHSFPWQVAIVDKMVPTFAFCGATIICPRYILTAAHCVEASPGLTVDPKLILVIAGIHNVRNTLEKTRTQHHISKIFIHPNRGEWSYDFAILDLARDSHIQIRKEAKAAHLPVLADQKTLSRRVLIVSGWGDLENAAKKGSAKLMFAKVPFVSDQQCMDRWGAEIGEGAESLFCAGYDEGGIDSCQGDSGGPLVTLDDGGKLKLMGTVATGGDCGVTYALYGKVTLVLDWINEKTGGCNARTCGKGNCVTKKDLGAAYRYFQKK